MSAIRFIIVVATVALLFAFYIITNSSSLLLHVGKEHFYSYITQGTQTISAKNSFAPYVYQLLAVNQEGQQRILTLKTHRELPLRSYLQMYVDEKGKITDWDEIRRENLPASIAPRIQ